jgi:hypothetical protein
MNEAFFRSPSATGLTRYRAACDLARLWRGQGKRKEARHLLSLI